MLGASSLFAFLSLPYVAETCPECVTAGPTNSEASPAWLEALKADRNKTLQNIGWKGGVFDVPALGWTQSAYIQPQMHPYDQFFYDKASHKYTVSRYLEDLKDRYGGIDALLMWPTYTNIGIDDRNQFDYFRSMPGGLEAVSRITRELKEVGVRVLWPYNPWDTGTRREPLSDEDTFAKLLKETNGDGFNGDTMTVVPKSFWQAAQNWSYPLAFEPEVGGEDMSLNWDTMGWGYWNEPEPSREDTSLNWDTMERGYRNQADRLTGTIVPVPDWTYPKIPVVDRFKFLTSGKFMTNVCDRWAKDKTDTLQMAWFNGAGYETWENVWGMWNGITPRDGEAIRRVATMLRFFGRQGHLHSPDWEPHTLGVIHSSDVFASKFPLQDHVLFTFVNRGLKNITGPQLRVQNESNLKYYDCYHGVELTPTLNGEVSVLSFELEAGGYGCVLSTIQDANHDYMTFLSTMKQMTQRRLSSYDHTWQYLKQSIVPIPKTKPAATAPVGMVLVPKSSYTFTVQGVEIEGDDSTGVDVQYPWDTNPHRTHSHKMEVGPFFIDKFPVTTANYSAYLKSTNYEPVDPYNWLKNWDGSTTPPAALADAPVTYISLDEARAYCAWAHGGSRLPHEWEWQYAAQGTDGRVYPWGNTSDQQRFPIEKSGNVFPGPESVMAHAGLGDSPFGVSDLIGNVWQYTDEFQDSHTRAVILRGGSNYRPAGSDWYFPQAKELNTHGKMFLMDDRYERAGTVGFRCVKDVDESVSHIPDVWLI